MKRWISLLALTLAACGSDGPSSGETCGTRAAVSQGPAWARDAVFYELFVRSFADGDGDGVGDLKGLTSRLDYLNDGKPGGSDLGVEGLWLMPIFQAASYHGYDAVDYEAIDPAYGTLQDFQTLAREAHERGIHILLDLVINHTSDQHPWFSSRRDYYVWANSDLGWRQPWLNGGPAWHPGSGGFYYGVFWSGMPDLNYNNPDVRAEMERVANLWLDRGADGFRLDAVRYLIETGPGQQQDTPPTHAYWKELRAAVKAHKPDAYLIGEAWAETEVIGPYYGNGSDELDSNFNFPLKDAIRGAAQGNHGSLDSVLCAVAQKYPGGVLDGLFTGNHDMARFARADLPPRSLKLAAALLLTLPGAPFVYYGEEIGMLDGAIAGGGDINYRTPMLWTGGQNAGFTTGQPWLDVNAEKSRVNVQSQLGDPGSTLAAYRDLISLRKAEPPLRGGRLLLLEASSGALVAYAREQGGRAVVVALNPGGSEATGATVDLSGLTPGSVFDAMTGTPGQALNASNAQAYPLPTIPAGGWRILSVRP